MPLHLSTSFALTTGSKLTSDKPGLEYLYKPGLFFLKSSWPPPAMIHESAKLVLSLKMERIEIAIIAQNPDSIEINIPPGTFSQKFLDLLNLLKFTEPGAEFTLEINQDTQELLLKLKGQPHPENPAGGHVVARIPFSAMINLGRVHPASPGLRGASRTPPEITE